MSKLNYEEITRIWNAVEGKESCGRPIAAIIHEKCTNFIQVIMIREGDEADTYTRERQSANAPWGAWLRNGMPLE